MIVGELTLPKFDGKEIAPGVWAVSEPFPVVGTNKFRCLASIEGVLVLLECSIRFVPLNTPAHLPDTEVQ